MTTTTIKNEVREIEKHIKGMTSNKDEQIKIISHAQSLVTGDESIIAVFAIVKNRIIHS